MIFGLPSVQTVILLVFLVPLISGQFEEEYGYPTTKWYMRAPQSISGLFRRLIGRRKNTIRTGFQGTAVANGPYSTQPSSYYSSFLSNPFSSSSSSSPVTGPGYPGSPAQQSSGFSSNLWSPNLSSYTNVVQGPLPAAGTNYPTYSPPASGPGSGNPANLDFHAVLDQFVRSAGLSPTGDQDTSASTVTQTKGDSPVFSFKKLYSFPFYLSTDQQPSDQGFNLQIPYMRKHIRRALHEGSGKNPKFFADKQSIQNWLHPKNWYYGQQALQQSASSLIPTTTNIQWPNGQEINPVLNAGQRFYRGKQPVGHNQGVPGNMQLHHQHQAIPSTIGSPVAPISGVPSPLLPAGSPKPGHHQPQQGQKIAAPLPSSQPAQSSTSSISSSASVPSVSSVSSSSATPTVNSAQSSQSQSQSQSQSTSTSSGQLTDPNILSSQAFIAQYLQEQMAASPNQKQPRGLGMKDDQGPSESQFASAYYFPNNLQPQSEQSKQSQLISGQEKIQSASGLSTSSSISSSSTLVSGDQSSPHNSYQVSYSSGGYGTSS